MGFPLMVTGTSSGQTLSGAMHFPTGELIPFTLRTTTSGLIMVIQGDPTEVPFTPIGSGWSAGAASPAPTHTPSHAPAPAATYAPASSGVTTLQARGNVARGEQWEGMGWSFRTPQGWRRAEQDGTHILGGDTEAGLISVMSSTYRDPNALQQGLVQQLGTMGTFSLEPLSNTTLSAGQAWYTEGTGQTWDGTQARVRAVSVIGPQLTAVTVGMTTPEHYATLRERVDSIARSFKFPKVEAGSLQQALVGQWWSYSGGSTSLTSGGTERQLALCADGRYFSSSESSYSGSFDSSGTYTGTPGLITDEGGWGSAGRTSTTARWSARGNATSGVIIVGHPDGSTTQIAYERQAEGDYSFDGYVHGRVENTWCR